VENSVPLHKVEQHQPHRVLYHKVKLPQAHRALHHKVVLLLTHGLHHKPALDPRHKSALDPRHKAALDPRHKAALVLRHKVVQHLIHRVLQEELLHTEIQHTLIHVRILLRIIRGNGLKVEQTHNVHHTWVLKVQRLPVQAVTIDREEDNKASIRRKQELAIRHNVLKEREEQNKVHEGQDNVRVTMVHRGQAHKQAPADVQHNARVQMLHEHRSGASQSSKRNQPGQ
jgi:hypothetical protein